MDRECLWTEVPSVHCLSRVFVSSFIDSFRPMSRPSVAPAEQESITRNGSYEPWDMDGTPHGNVRSRPTNDSSSNTLSTANSGLSVDARKTLSGMISSIQPRATMSATSFLEHTSSLEDALREGELFDAYMLGARPDFRTVANGFRDDGLSSDQLASVYETAVAVYDRDNDYIFSIYRAALDLSGPFHELDIVHIRKHFTLPGRTDGKRDGMALIKWVRKFQQRDDFDSQSKIAEDLVAYRTPAKRLPITSSLPQIAVHIHAFTQLWLSCHGNVALLETEPQSFSLSLLNTFPQAPNDSPVVFLRRWMAEQISNNASSTNSDVDDFSIAILKHAKILGIPSERNEADRRLLALQKEDKAAAKAAWDKKCEIDCTRTQRPQRVRG